MKNDNEPAQTWGARFPAWKGAAAMLVIIIGVYLLREHWGHVLGIAPYALLLACPLMHLFMHGGHGHHSHQGKTEAASDHKHPAGN